MPHLPQSDAFVNFKKDLASVTTSVLRNETQHPCVPYIRNTMAMIAVHCPLDMLIALADRFVEVHTNDLKAEAESN